jgi:hypothetical protein
MISKNQGDGAFFIRPRGTPGEFILSVVYKGRPSHHLVKARPDGVYTVNSKNINNTNATTISEVFTVPLFLNTIQEPKIVSA